MEIGDTAMGYYTNYSLTEEGTPKAIKAFQEDLVESSKYKGDILDLINYGSIYGKYYDLADEVKTVASRHPNVLVILQGEGEDHGDIWELRCKGRETEQQVMTMPPFENPALFTKDEKQQ